MSPLSPRPRSSADRHPQRPIRRPPEHHWARLSSQTHLYLLILTYLALLPIANANPRPLPPLASIPTRTLPTFPLLTSLPPLNASAPLLALVLPPAPRVFLTLNLCAVGANSSVRPTVLVSDEVAGGAGDGAEREWSLGSRPVRDAASGGMGVGERWNRKAREKGVWSVQWEKGFGNVTLEGREGGVGGALRVRVLLGLGLRLDGQMDDVNPQGNVLVQLGVSSSSPLHRISPRLPLLGDTTTTSALLFSPLHPQPLPRPSYPNYTLPHPPSIPSDPFPILALLLVPTSSSPSADGLDYSSCAVRAAHGSTGELGAARNAVMNRTLPLWGRLGAVSGGGELETNAGEEEEERGEGFRVGWVQGGLTGGTNYTAWMLDEASGELSGPIWLRTKQEGFSCALVLPTPECPNIAYAAPLSSTSDADADGTGAPLRALPSSIASALNAQLDAFHTTLLSAACGRDLYSRASSCADCAAAYRDWLCRMYIPRCALPSSASASDSNVGDDDTYPPTAIARRNASSPRNSAQRALVALSTSSGGVSPYLESYTELLPCLAECHAVERACPARMKFRCPHYSQGAARAYGFDMRVQRSAGGNGARGTEWPGRDVWGGEWCAM